MRLTSRKKWASCAAVSGLSVFVLVTVCPRPASAQWVGAGFALGGQGTFFLGTNALDTRLAAANRTQLYGPAGGFSFLTDFSILFARTELAIEGAFPGDDETRKALRFMGALTFGARLKTPEVVFLPSIGPTLSEINMCVEGPVGAVPPLDRPLFDQILASAGSGECLRALSTGVRFQIGVDREILGSDKPGTQPSLYFGMRAGVNVPVNSWWVWGDRDIEGPKMRMITPFLTLVVGFRALSSR